MEHLTLQIEALIFASPEPITIEDIQAVFDEREAIVDIKIIENTIEGLIEKYASDQYAFEIIRVAGGFQFMTKGAFYDVIERHLKNNSRKQLSKSALETLAIIAYRQPVPKSELEQIRGVSCDYAIQKLLEKDLVDVMGRSDAPGRPLLYGTSDKFMNYFGINSLKELPKLKEILPTENSIGELAPIENVIDKDEKN